MNTVRLLMLADRLESVPAPRFDMESWCEGEWEPGATEFPCGTTACALGYATTIPEFQALGLHLVRDYEYDPNHTYVVLGPTRHEHGTYMSSMLAARELFDLTHEQVMELFLPREGSPDWPDKRTPQQVAKLIRDVCARENRK